MRAPVSFGHLAPIVVPGLILVGALGLLVMATPIGAMVFNGPWIFVLLSVLAGTLVAGYLVAGLAGALADRRAGWTVPPAAHLAEGERAIRLPARAVERAGFATSGEVVSVPAHAAYALERSLAGAWGVPEDHWARTVFLQRLTVAFVVSVLFATAFLVGDALLGAGISRGIREHAGTIVVAGAVTGWLLANAVERARREAVLDLLADARAMVMDRGEHREVRRVLDEIGIELEGGEAAVGVPP
jgi:hypothetical protein